jgi:HAD superfamily phosphatase (TIGR01668 family)
LKKFSLTALFQPGEIVPSLREINFDRLKAGGIRGLILDIDDTLLPRNVNDIYPEVFEWVMARKEEGFRLCLISNNRHPLRVRSIGETLNLPALSMAFKPLPFAFWKALEFLATRPAETVMIGDQLFMDILGGNLIGLHTIFVKPLTEDTLLPRKWMRRAEKWILNQNP